MSMQLHYGGEDEGFYESQPLAISQNWSEEARAEYALLLLGTVSTATLASVTNRLLPLLQRDFIYSLPQELAVQILSCTDPKTVGRAAQVSKTWKRIASDNAIWRALFRTNGWTVNEQFLDQWTNKPITPPPQTTLNSKGKIVQQFNYNDSSKKSMNKNYGSVPKTIGSSSQDPGASSTPDNHSNPHDDRNVWGEDGTGSTSESVPRRSTRGIDDILFNTNTNLTDEHVDNVPSDLSYSTTGKHSNCQGKRINRKHSLLDSPTAMDAGTFKNDDVLLFASLPSNSLQRPDPVMSLPRLSSKVTDALSRPLSPTSISLPQTTDDIDVPLSPTLLAQSLERASLNSASDENNTILVKPFRRSNTDNWERHAHLDWKYIYQQRAKLDRNWTEGNYLVRELAGHNEAIYCLQFDESKIVSGSRDDTIKMWDMKTGECIRTLHGHGASVLCLQYDDQYLVSGSSDSTVIVWELQSGAPKKVLRSHTEPVLNLRFDAEYIASCSKDKTVKLWNTVTGDLLHTLKGHRAAVNAIQFANDLVVSASGDRTIKVWRISTGELIRTLSSHSRGIACIHLERNIIVSGSSDRTIRVWDVNTGMCLQTIMGHSDLVRTLQFDNHRIVSGSYDLTLKVWDYSKGNLVLDLKNGHTQKVFKLQFNDIRIVSCSQDQRILVWDFSQGVDTRFFV